MLNFFLGCMVGGTIATVFLCCFMVNKQEKLIDDVNQKGVV